MNRIETGSIQIFNAIEPQYNSVGLDKCLERPFQEPRGAGAGAGAGHCHGSAVKKKH